MPHMIRRIQSYARAQRNASLFGLRYTRARDFKLPTSIVLGGDRIEIRHLGSAGTRADFFVCLIYDHYRIRELSGRGLKTIVDVGANQGLFALAARAHSPNAQIFCYEPNQRLEEVLRHNCKLSKASVFFEAVGKSGGVCRLTIAAESNQSTTEPLSEGEVGVPQVALSDVVARAGGEVSLLKLDCEGAEWDILKADAIDGVKALAMEYHLWKSLSLTHEDAVQRVKGLGFIPIHIAHGASIGNIVAVRADT